MFLFLFLIYVLRSLNVIEVPVENVDERMTGIIDRKPCEVGKRGCTGPFFPDLKWNSHKVEPHTGIEFPIVLPGNFSEARNPDSTSEVSS